MVVVAESDDGSASVPAHPLNIKPSGNAYAAKMNIKSASGIFEYLPDDLWIQIMEYLDPSSLQSVGATCKAMYAFSTLEELWKNHCIRSYQRGRPWRGNWRSTFLSQAPSSSQAANIDCIGLFSDVLHRPFFCASISLSSFYQNVPAQNVIPHFSDLDHHEFTNHWTPKPFILSSPVKEWPIYRDWSIDRLVEEYGSVPFRAESVDWPLATYVEYMRNNGDESPLYLFDRSFVSKMSLKTDAYTVPECFGDDLFTVLGDQRPDHAWLIIGPERGGSTFHKDPNATSAWNAVIRGAKYWIMFPAGSPPPGVYMSEDQSEVTSPLSIAEWLLGFHAEARKSPGCMEGICAEGELLHVPSGWWHLVVNLEDAIAVTQNFVPENHLTDVLDFLKNKPEQVSGFRKNVQSPYDLFRARMAMQYPGLLQASSNSLEQRQNRKKRKWNQLVAENDPVENEVGFTFTFGDDSDEDIP